MSKPSFINLIRLRTSICGFTQFWVRLLHEIANGKGHLIKERFGLSEQPAMSDSAANDFTQHVAAAFIRRQHSIRNQKGCCPRVVRDYPQRCRPLAVCLLI